MYTSPGGGRDATRHEKMQSMIVPDMTTVPVDCRVRRTGWGAPGGLRTQCGRLKTRFAIMHDVINIIKFGKTK